MLLHETPHGDRTWEPRTTRCTSTTQSTYAQGHDAKLRKFLVEAGVAGVQVRKSEEKVVVERDAVRIADDLGWGDDVRKAVEKGRGEA
ncbi:hypothetical protein AQF52_6721 [Streptomyces venezuelae]|uniref:Uncharacterized protein n=1 Tax=Streptomyces venezuelae TaxID=54571 RepID=A0A5P2B285_STRVZ|nr:hypothetical protein AQF52_6721 [Streptomyces venezuelae]QES24426.1 hypothetical protein DEJ46_05100 [Streptomyces venezuelae]QPK50852.1 hypothetical protein H4W23_33755 [Streptomyces gardneri]